MTGKKLFALVVILLVATVTLAADQPAGGMAVGQTRNFTLFDAAQVGGTVLPAGQYKVKHTMEGESHVMVFQQIDGKATAKVNCKMVQLEKKVSIGGQTFKTENNVRVLTSITWKGDTIRHEFTD
ncbi:MAG TPA: hypothetical protein VFU76_00210 [Terriglobales bacterium]|nr:hypothetical protein [Terriglobales bacterium]